MLTAADRVMFRHSNISVMICLEAKSDDMPRSKRSKRKDDSTLQMALVGYELERQRIAEQISRVQALLGERAATRDGSQPTRAKKRVLSPAVRKKIAEATRRRWAAYRKAKATK
jgi:hypothetical protein